MTELQVHDTEREAHDQEEFDEAVKRDGKIVLEWLAGLGVVAALLMSILALNQSSERNTVTVTTGEAAPATRYTSVPATASLPAKTISLQVVAEGKAGP